MRVVVVGAGLSGLSLAAFLRRLGVDCVVLEQAPYLSANYQLPVTLYANALSCFKAFEMGSFFDSAMRPPENQFGIRDPRGRWLLRSRNREVKLGMLREDDAIPSSTAPKANSESVVSRAIAEELKIELGRVPLRATYSAFALKHMLRQFCGEIRFGCTAVDLVPHDGIKGGVHVVLQDGSTEWGDVVVGADGLHSSVRRMLYPHEHVGTSAGSLNMTTIDGFTDLGTLPSGEELADSEHPAEFWGHRRTVSYYPLFHQGEKRVGFSCTLFDAPQQLVDPAMQRGGGSHGGATQQGEALSDEKLRDVYRGVLATEFASFPPSIVRILRNADVALPSEALEVPIMPRWFNRRAVLIGEAAHGAIPCFLGQDSSLCVEDAAVLAVSLLEVPLPTDAGYEYAFRTYETSRRQRIERYIRQSRTARKFTSTHHAGLRDAALRVTPSVSWYMLQRWLSDWRYSSNVIDVDPRTRMHLRYRI